MNIVHNRKAEVTNAIKYSSRRVLSCEKKMINNCALNSCVQIIITDFLVF